MRRRGLPRAATVGLAIGALLWSGMLAAADDNRDDDRAAAHRVEVTRAAANAKKCGPDGWGHGTASAVLSATVDGDTAEVGTSSGLADICVRNFGRRTGRLLISATNVVDLEVGACASGERELGGDTTCVAGSQGELAPVIALLFGAPRTGSAGACATLGAVGLTSLTATPRVLAVDLKPGEMCRLGPLAARFADGVSTTQKHRSQTDRVQLELVFTLRD